MKKFRDYIKRKYNDDLPFTVSRVMPVWADVKSEGIKELELSSDEYSALAFYFSPQLPWNWSGKTIWGIRLVIKKPSIPSIIERIADVGRKADEQMWKVEKIELGKKEFEELIQETRGLGGCGEIFGVKIERAILQDSYFQPFYIIESPKLKNYTRKTNLTK